MSVPSTAAKRGREAGGPATVRPPSRWAAEVEAGEQLDRLRDTTEGTATGADEDVALTAYGGEYFLNEDYMAKLSKHHKHGPGGGGGGGGDHHHDDDARGGGGGQHRGGGGRGGDDDDREKIDVFANLTAAQPAFFTSGNDFPPVPAPSGQAATAKAKAVVIAGAMNENNDDDADGDRADDVLTATMWVAAHNADMDIILPVVDPDCSLAQCATKGSQSLAELRRLMQREKINRDVMDTSKSDLARLLKKDGALGQLVNPTGDNNVDSGSGDRAMRGADAGHRQQRQAEQDEEEALLRRIRLERRAMDGGDKDGASTDADRRQQQPSAHPPPSSSRDDARLRARQDKTHQIHSEQQRIAVAAESQAAEDRRAQLAEQRRSLPIFRCKGELMRYIGENAVTVVVGDTGSGKTTQLVQYLHDAGYAAGGKVIGCTQPRRLAAMGVARRVSDEMGCALGTAVGYSIHLDDTTTEATQIKFMTDGVMLREIVKDPNVSKYSVIVLDEAHERSVDTDVLMGVLKLAICRRGDLKLIVTSATMDINKFSAFFGNAPFYEIPGQTFEVDIKYAPSIVTDYCAEAVFRVCQLHLQAPLDGKNDILVFMTGRDDVYGTCEMIKRRLKELSDKHLDSLLVMPCLSEAASLTAGGEGGGGTGAIGVLDPTPAGKRKCVVATNVAETSLTIDGVRFVIDCGFMKTNVFRPKIGMNTLQRYPVSQAQAGQRKGRAGRTTEGVCFRLYTEEQHAHQMLVNSVPEIQRSSVDSVMLLLKSIGVTRIADFDFMDPPPIVNTRNSMWHLWLLGLLDGDGGITAEGRLALEFPMSPALSKLLVESTRYGCSLEVARIVSLVTADPKSLFELPKGKEEIAQQHHGRFYNNESDHLTLLNAFTQFLENGKSWQWAQDHFLHAPTLVRACDVLDQLLERLQRLRLPTVSCGPGGYDKVRYCICRAFCLQAAQRSGSNWNEYRPLLNLGVVCTLHPSSSVCSRAEMPPFVVYNDLLMVSTKEYLVMVTTVEPEWLVASSHGLYSMRKGGRLWQPPRDAEALLGFKDSNSVTGGGGGGVKGDCRATPRVNASPPPVAAVVAPRPAAPPAATAAKKAAGPASKFSFATGKRRQNI